MFSNLDLFLRSSFNTSQIKILKNFIIRLFVSIFILLFLQASLLGNPLVQRPLAPPDTSSPQATLKSFVDNFNRGYHLIFNAYHQYGKESGLFPSSSVSQQIEQGSILFKRVLNCMNLSQVPPRLKRREGFLTVIMLKEILDRIEVPPYEQIPDVEAVASDKEMSRWTIPNTEITIVKVEEGNRAGEFLFSPETVARTKEFYNKIQNLPYKPGATEGVYQFSLSLAGRLDWLLPFKLIQALPSWFNNIYWEQTLWQWIGLIITLFVAVFIIYMNFRWNWQRIIYLNPPYRTWLILLPLLISIFAVVGVNLFIDYWLNINGYLFVILLTILEIILWILVAIIIFLFGNAVAETIISSPIINSEGIDASAIRVISPLLGLAIGTTVLILGLERVGISLIPFLAGLGIGGLALALAARTTVENIIGGLILFIDRPVSLGDFCRFGEQLGTVENIGLRSTRIRGLDRTVTSIPNADFSQMNLVNYSQRDIILLKKTVGLRYETTSEQLRFLLAKIRELLLSHPKLLEQPARVRFIDYGNYSLNVEIYVYVDTKDWNEFLGIQEDVLLRVKDIIKLAGTDFAVPSQRNYISRDSGINSEKSCAAAAQVQAWRMDGILPFPEFSSEQSEKFRNSLDFPPKGSPNSFTKKEDNSSR